MKAILANKDGMISKEEIITFHESMCDTMMKSKNGTHRVVSPNGGNGRSAVQHQIPVTGSLMIGKPP